MTVEFKNTTDHKTLVVGSGDDATDLEPGQTVKTTEDEVEGYLDRGYGEIVGESEESSEPEDNTSQDGDEEVSEFREQLLKVDGVDDEIADQIEDDFDNFAEFYDAVANEDYDLTSYEGVGDVTAEDITAYLDEKVEKE